MHRACGSFEVRALLLWRTIGDMHAKARARNRALDTVLLGVGKRWGNGAACLLTRPYRDHRLFDKQVDYFAQRARCLVWDPPSHGESRPFPLDWSLDDLALMLEQILSREGFERPILIGQSMGGYVSQAFIRLFPDRACGFVSVDSCPLDRSYYTAIELWALKHVKGIYRAIPWKSLCSMGSKGCATSEYGRALCGR